MKRLRVREFGKNVYKFNLQNEKVLEGSEDYSKYREYFRKLLMSVPKCVKNFTFILEVTEEARLMKLYLNKSQMQYAEDVKEVLLKFEEVKQVGIVPKDFGLEMDVMDMFFEYQG